MERDTKHISAETTSTDYDLTYESWLKKDDNGNKISVLFPELPKDYFKGKKSPLVPIKWLPRKRTVQPYVRSRDLNNDKDNWFEDNKPKRAWEIGIKIDF